jgi:hypothetical protein
VGAAGVEMVGGIFTSEKKDDFVTGNVGESQFDAGYLLDISSRGLLRMLRGSIGH